MSRALCVIVCTRNRHAVLVDALADVRAQLGPMDRLVVVDQSDDSGPTAAWIATAADERVTHAVSAERGLPQARRHGLTLATAPIVVFFDDDVRLAPGCLEAHRRAYDDGWVGGVVGRLLGPGERPNHPGLANHIGWDGRVRVRLTGTHAGPVGTLKGANMSFRRCALAAVGPPDAGYGGTAFLEDADLSTRVARSGWELRFEPNAEVLHLSAPEGGCRDTASRAAWWRAHNTGYFFARHRPWALALAGIGMGGAALRHAAQHHDPVAVPRLLGALVRGYAEGLSARSAGSGSGSP